MSLPLEQAQAMSISEPAGIPASALMRVQVEAANYLCNAKELKDWINGAVAMKYDQKLANLRAQPGKDTGIVNFKMN